MAAEEGFYIFTTMRFDPALRTTIDTNLDPDGFNARIQSPFYLLPYHQDRLLKAATHFGWAPAIKDLTGRLGLLYVAERAFKFLQNPHHSPVRLRLTIGPDGIFHYEKFDIPDLPLPNLLPTTLPAPGATPGPEEPVELPPYTLVVDDARATRSEFTYFKTAKREFYTAAREKAGIKPGDSKEVLIIGDDNFVMEASITTPYFWRDGKWVTPPVAKQFSAEAEATGGHDGVSRRYALAR